MVEEHSLRTQPRPLSALSRPQPDDGTAQPAELGGIHRHLRPGLA
jgi:hypothetical protein